VVKDENGQALTYMYFEKEPRRRFRRELFTRDEAQRIAVLFAKPALGSPTSIDAPPKRSSGVHLHLAMRPELVCWGVERRTAL
jgi:hypothetical protein